MKTQKKIMLLTVVLFFSASMLNLSCNKSQISEPNEISIEESILSEAPATPPPLVSTTPCWKKVKSTTCGACYVYTLWKGVFSVGSQHRFFFRTSTTGAYSNLAVTPFASVNSAIDYPYLEYIISINAPSATTTGTVLTAICP